MKASELRQSILQAAVQGKLVPQDSYDEPASVLLERISAEKSKLVKEGKIKKEKPLPPIAEDEVPYDLPEGWVWCRLGEVILFVSTGPFGSMLHKSDYVESGIPLVNPANMKNGLIISSDKMLVDEVTRKRLSSYILHEGDIVIARRGELGRCAAVTANEDGWLCGTGSFFLRLASGMMLSYFLLFFQSPLCKEQLLGESVGSTMNNLNHNILKNVHLPMPSVDEQERIVSKVDELMQLCDELEDAESELEALEDHFIEYLPKFILHLAVQGKLLPQNLHDEPASELLTRIRAERTQLIKEGKIKKEKPLPPIAEDEAPYDLPEGWVWCRLGEIIYLLSGRDLETKHFYDFENGIPYITGASAICNNEIIVTRWTTDPVVISNAGDLLLSCKGTVGKIAFNHIGDCHIARQIMAIRFPHSSVNKDYVRIFLESYVPQLIIQSKSIIPGISRNDILFTMIPFPPLAEQRRITAKVDELMELCDELKAAKSMPVKRTEDNVVEFPQRTKLEEEIGIAARGDAEQPYSPKLQNTINKLFKGGSHE